MYLNLNAADQVAYLRDKKDVAFNLMDEEAAVRFLSNRNYFFKLKAFAKNYEKRFKEGDGKGRYIGLEFAYLVELSRVDRQLRDLVLRLTLDIEHCLKVRINRGAMAEGCDPCELAEKYLDYSRNNAIKEQVSKMDADGASKTFARIRSVMDGVGEGLDPASAVAIANELEGVLGEITFGRDPDHVRSSYAAMGTSPYSKGIVEKYGEADMPYWCLMELISFGPLIGFYKACFRKGGFLDSSEERATLKAASNLLRRVQTLRNAAAHGDCLLNGLSNYVRSKSASGVKKALQVREGLAGDVVNQVSSVAVAMDLAAVLMCYDIFVPEGYTRSSAADELRAFAKRAAEKKDWFEKNYAIKSFIDYVVLVFLHFADKFEWKDRREGEPAKA